MSWFKAYKSAARSSNVLVNTEITNVLHWLLICNHLIVHIDKSRFDRWWWHFYFEMSAQIFVLRFLWKLCIDCSTFKRFAWILYKKTSFGTTYVMLTRKDNVSESVQPTFGTCTTICFAVIRSWRFGCD